MHAWCIASARVCVLAVLAAELRVDRQEDHQLAVLEALSRVSAFSLSLSLSLSLSCSFPFPFPFSRALSLSRSRFFLFLFFVVLESKNRLAPRYGCEWLR